VNKIAQYLNKHLVGEVTTDPQIIKKHSTDGSILTISPDMVMYPMVTNDVRKATRFAWQLAEKGHTLSITPRGSGSDRTGGAIGKGVVVSFPTHMRHIYEYDAKQKLVRLQPGVSISALLGALSLYGTSVPGLRLLPPSRTVGGAVSSMRAAGDYVKQLEVVLSNGDVLQTKKLSKRELSRKKGLQTFEGDIYRQVDALIEDYADVIAEKCDIEHAEHAGYFALADVKQKDGSFDLTPLFIGSQATLGIISEMIVKAEYINQNPAIIAIAFNELDSAYDAIEAAEKIQPSSLEFIDGSYFEVAKAAGKEFSFYEQARQNGDVEAVIVATFDDFNERARARKLKKFVKIAKPLGGVVDQAIDESVSELHAVRTVTSFTLTPSTHDASTPPLIDGLYVPVDRFEEFSARAQGIASKHHVELSFYGHPLDGHWSARPQVKLGTVTGKQTSMKLISEIALLARQHEGTLFGEMGEGRLRTVAAKQMLDPELQTMFQEVKDIFDPHGILNRGVKVGTNPQELGKQLRSDFSASLTGELPRH